MVDSNCELQVLEKEFDALAEIYSESDRARYISKEQYEFKKINQSIQIKDLIKQRVDNGCFYLEVNRSKYEKEVLLELLKERYGNSREWYVNGKRHRLDGPAVEFNDGERIWFIKDKRFASKEKMESSIEYYLCINGLENYG